MIAALDGIRGGINSVVIKLCDSKEEAEKYILDIEESNRILKKIL
jgi:hypothetical protein